MIEEKWAKYADTTLSFDVWVKRFDKPWYWLKRHKAVIERDVDAALYMLKLTRDAAKEESNAA